jgi:hypothetical protein
VATVVVAAPSLICIEALGRVPVAGVLIQCLLVTVGFGAVCITYVGLQEFEPARMLEGERETPSERTCKWGPNGPAGGGRP